MSAQPTGTDAGGRGPRPLRIVLAGAHGFGRNYLPVLRELAAEGKAVLSGVCDLAPLPPGRLEDLGSPAQGDDLGRLVEDAGADIAIIATPLHTHAALAHAALDAGAHLMLEKPPVASLAQFEALMAATRRHRRICQVGFQSLGSRAPAAARRLIADGAVGRVRGIGAAAAWSRDTSYYARAPWAGRRRLDDGTDVVDGALTNPLAHAVATALAVDGGEIVSLETELYRAFDIEADDTSCLRVRTRGGLTDGTPVVVAAALTASEQRPPVVTVHGERGRIELEYTRDRVTLVRDGQSPVTTVHPRTALLRDLVARLSGGTGSAPDGAPSPEPLVPLAATRSFMRVLEAVRTAPDPVPVPSRDLPGTGGARRRVVPGVTGLVADAAARLSLFSELPQFPQFSGLPGRN